MPAFPATRPSAVDGLASMDASRREAALRVIAEVYWTAIYKLLRLRFQMTREQAEDSVQGFFEHLLEGDLLRSYDATRGRFRTFIRRCVEHYAIDRHRRATTKRRGAGQLQLAFEDCEAELVTLPVGEDVFEQEWLRRVMVVAVERLLVVLEERGKHVHAALFRRFHLQDEPPSYEAAAAELGIKVTDATNWLHVGRRELRRVALELLREISANEEEFLDSAKNVFGIDLSSDDS